MCAVLTKIVIYQYILVITKVEFYPCPASLKTRHSRVDRNKLIGQEVQGKATRRQGADEKVWECGVITKLEFYPCPASLKTWRSRVDGKKLIGQEFQGKAMRRQGTDEQVWGMRYPAL